MKVATNMSSWPWDTLHTQWIKSIFSKANKLRAIQLLLTKMKDSQLAMLKTVSRHTDQWIDGESDTFVQDGQAGRQWWIHPDYQAWTEQLPTKLWADDRDVPDVHCGEMNNGHVEFWHVHQPLQQRLLCAEVR